MKLRKLTGSMNFSFVPPTHSFLSLRNAAVNSLSKRRHFSLSLRTPRRRGRRRNDAHYVCAAYVQCTCIVYVCCTCKVVALRKHHVQCHFTLRRCAAFGFTSRLSRCIRLRVKRGGARGGKQGSVACSTCRSERVNERNEQRMRTQERLLRCLFLGADTAGGGAARGYLLCFSKRGEVVLHEQLEERVSRVHIEGEEDDAYA